MVKDHGAKMSQDLFGWKIPAAGSGMANLWTSAIIGLAVALLAI